ncbi:MAG: S-layer homology domain-containing protein [Oscillospiraceae bacterium]|nr:S-layer homology domain-containing protein [Oscillospiraceae bacterium]
MKRLISFILLITLILFVAPISSSAANVSDFSDVHAADWFYNSVSFVTQNGMFNGTNASSFSPDGTMTRGMFVTVLGRYGGAPSVSDGTTLGTVTKSDVRLRTAPSTTAGTAVLAVLQSGTQVEVLNTIADSSDLAYTWYYVKYKGMLGYIRNDMMEITESGFSDVPSSEYYSPYVQWAFSSGIASATGDDTFSPERDITREEICSMLVNYARFKNYQLKPVVSAVSFMDSSLISSGYASAVSTMQLAGVVNGYEDGSFRPKGSATRAEVSKLLMYFINALGYKQVSEASFDSAGNYIFGTEVPSKATVGNDYFSNACFIGHSLVNGMQTTFGLSNTDFYARNSATAKYFLGLSDFTLSSSHIDSNGNTVADTGTLEQALALKSYGKVYIMLGINEIGSTDSSRQSFYTSMSNIITLVRKTQPNAVIYLFSLTAVSQSCSESSASFNRDNIVAFNTVIKQLCKDKKTYYLNVFDLLCNSNGFLPASAGSSDGIHLLSSEYVKIKTYLLSHTV